jgi:cytochrome b pre-mRNA-processing protein 3
MGLFERLFGRPQRADAQTLYASVVARARLPHWYIEGGVADSRDGRFDMIAAILALVLIELENRQAAQMSVALTERFIEDMDAQLREDGVGDVGLGKQVGTMVSMLGGRLSAYRDALANDDLAPALTRNLYRGIAPAPAAIAHVAAELKRFAGQLRAASLEMLATGDLP